MLTLLPKKSRPIMAQIKPDLDEMALLQGIIAGDVSAFEAFYKLYYPRLHRFILRTTHQPEQIEELIQETLLLVWQQPERFNYQSKISTWVFGIAYHKCLKALSQYAKYSQDVDIEEFKEFLDDPLANFTETVETQNWLNQALASLSAEHRAVIELTFYHDLPYQDIARIMDCPENTVKTRMFHARKKLQAFAQAKEN